MNRRLLCYFFIAALPLAAQTAANCPTDPSVQAQIVNTAAGVAGNYAGYTFLTISGLNMPTGSQSISTLVSGAVLPVAMSGVSVLVNGTRSYLFSYTPKQVMVLLPRAHPNSCVTLDVEANGLIQFQAQIFFNATAPGLFTYADGETVIASHGDWSLVTPAAPAHAGEWISLWAGGLGLTNPDFSQTNLPVFAAELADKANFSVLLNGIPVDPTLIEYAGIAPNFAGLYQINVQVPAGTPPNPEIRLRTADNISPPQRFLAVQ